MSIITVENISPQTVPFMYSAIDASASETSVPASQSGILHLATSKRIDLELTRIDQAQLDSLRKLGLIKYTIH